MGRSPRTASGSPTCRSRTSRSSPAPFARAELPRRHRVADLDRRPGGLRDHEGSARRLERLQPDVGRRHGLLPVRPRRPDHAVRLRHGDEGRSAGVLDPGDADIKSAVGRRRRHRVRPVRHAAPVRPEDRGSPARFRSTCRGRPAGVRPKIEKVAKTIRNAGLSPTGARAVFEARGEILTVPAEKGDVRNLTNTPGAAERDPAWSPDGKSIAYFSDESGEYELHVRPQDGRGEVEEVQARRRPVVLLQPGLVARRQEDRLHRQAPQPLVHRPRHRQVARRWTPTLDEDRPGRRRLVARTAMARLHPAAEELPERRLPLLAGRRARRTRSPTA